MSQKLVPLLIVSTMICSSVLADQITLKNGNRLTGKIIKSDTENLVIKSEFAGEVKAQWAAIQEVSSSAPLYVTSRDGQVLVGTVTTTEGKFEIQTKEAGRVAITKDAVQLIRSEEEQAAYVAEVERLRDPGLTDLWSGTVDAGLSTTRGNADTLTVALGAQAARITRRDKTSVYAASLFARNSTAGESITTANATRGGLRYDFNLSDRLFAFGLTDLEADKFQRLDLRLVLGGGLGYHARRTERTRLDLFTGGTFNQEYFSNNLRRKSGEVLLGEELTFKLSDRVSLTERAVIFPNVTELGEYRISFDTTAVTSLTKRLGFQVTVSDRFISNPIPGIKKNDLLLSTGIRLSFGDAAGLKR